MFDNNKPLVSVITPCYNGEKYLRDYFESLLNQDYRNIEFFFINDGSTDSTEDIAIEYEKKFNKKGIKYSHFIIENSGQAAAINVALSKINGKYLIWPDSDDVLLENNFSLKVEYLEKHPDIDLVFTQAQCTDENLKPITGHILYRKNQKKNANVFLDYIDENDVVFAPGVFMVRVFTLRKVLPDMKIYDSRGGQNWQFILPVTYIGKCGYINNITYLYRIHYSSHSHQADSIEKQLKQINCHEDILINVVTKICNNNIKEKNRLIKRIKIKYLYAKIKIYLRNHDRSSIIICIKKILNIESLNILDVFYIIKRIIFDIKLLFTFCFFTKKMNT